MLPERKRGVGAEPERGEAASAPEHRLWSPLSFGAGLGEAASFPAHCIDEIFRGQTKVTMRGQDVSRDCLDPQPLPPVHSRRHPIRGPKGLYFKGEELPFRASGPLRVATAGI